MTVTTETKEGRMPKRIRQGKAWAKTTGKPVLDAVEPLEIHLTREDIANGDPKDQLRCAFAVAIEREMGASAVWVGKSYTYAEWEDEVERFKTPQSMARELVSYDRGAKMEPGDYALAPPVPSNRMDAPPRPRSKKAARKAQGTTERRPRRGTPHKTANVRHG